MTPARGLIGIGADALEAVEAGDLDAFDRHRRLDDVGGEQILAEAEPAGLEEAALIGGEDLRERLLQLGAEVAAAWRGPRA